jgi:5-formyltetrahydrofolate cyclo-ligase
MEEKKAIRKQMLEYLMEQTEFERQLKSDLIFNRVISLDDWKQATCIAITISRIFEVNTKKLIEQAWREKKQVAVPKCIPATREMVFYLISSFYQLEVVYAGLYEPKISKTKLISSDAIDLVILPGLAFTLHGHRLGFGGGYYDRFLKNFDGNVMALAFNFQMHLSLPVENHDIAVNQIVTEKSIIGAGTESG